MMDDLKAADFFSKFLNPELYETSDEMSVELRQRFSKDVLIEVKGALSRIIAKPATAISKAETYFDMKYDDEERAQYLLNRSEIVIAKAIGYLK